MPNSERYGSRISLFGNFGTGNFGNESTLRAMLYHLRRFMPDAHILCICSAPDIVSADYNIPAVPIEGVIVKPWTWLNPVARLVRKLFIGIPSELYRWLKAFRTLRDTDMLMVVGTGLMTDAFGIRTCGPYSMFKWSLIAKLCRCRLVFVSVGAGPLRSRAGRLFVKSALSLASFRSYRDVATLEYLKGIGFRSRDGRVYPDLAFSLPAARPDGRSPDRRRPVIGLGLMSFASMYGTEKTTVSHYAAYIETLVVFVEWLLERQYDVRLLIGALHDVPVIQEFNALLKARLVMPEDERIIAGPITSSEELMDQLATTDFVIATRFHNVVLALFANKPSIAISFHDKCSALMSQMGLSEYCVDIRQLQPAELIQKFCDIETNAEKLRAMIRSRADACREALNEQYELLFKPMLPDSLEYCGASKDCEQQSVQEW